LKKVCWILKNTRNTRLELFSFWNKVNLFFRN
jgi:hypothetical protein